MIDLFKTLNDTELDQLIDDSKKLFDEYSRDTYYLLRFHLDLKKEREQRRRNHSGM